MGNWNGFLVIFGPCTMRNLIGFFAVFSLLIKRELRQNMYGDIISSYKEVKSQTVVQILWYYTFFWCRAIYVFREYIASLALRWFFLLHSALNVKFYVDEFFLRFLWPICPHPSADTRVLVQYQVPGVKNMRVMWWYVMFFLIICIVSNTTAMIRI